MSNVVASIAGRTAGDRPPVPRRDVLCYSVLYAAAVRALACDSGGSDMEDEGTEVAQPFSGTVEEIDSSYRYSDQNGVGAAYAIDGEVGRGITLERSATYEFDFGRSVESGPGDSPHSCYVDRTLESQGTSPSSDGVKNPEALTGGLPFAVRPSAPTTLFSQCGNHVYMGGEMVIEDAFDN